MPLKDLTARKAYDAERRVQIMADPKKLEKRRESTRKSQARRMQDPANRVIQLQRTAAWRLANLDYRAAWSLRKKYGLTLKQYWAMFDSQGGVCAICRRPELAIEPRTDQPRRLTVDHCHVTGKVRALLCFRCNSGLGKFDDNPAALRAAAAYLESHAQR